MSLVNDLLVILSSYSGGYRLIRRRMRGDTRPVVPVHLKDASEATLRVMLSRLKKRGLVKNQRRAWFITAAGKTYITKKFPYGGFSSSNDHSRRPKNMVIAFDIPEKFKRERDWLREQLSLLGFTMLQKSVWFGPAPLPKQFVVSLREVKILDFLKFFKAEEQDIV